VTHDQEEALTMSDRIAVMADGKVEQVAPPREVYEEPSTVFVADFLGVSNLMDAEAVGGANICRLQLGDFELDATQGKTDARGAVQVTIRPERVHLEPQDATGPNRVPGMVERLVYLGNSVQIIVHLAVGTTIQALVQNVGTEIPWKQGTAVQAHLPADALRVLEDTGAALAPLDEGAVPA
jgi:spermidine/putrescine transport system ATP-binding protein